MVFIKVLVWNKIINLLALCPDFLILMDRYELASLAKLAALALARGTVTHQL